MVITTHVCFRTERETLLASILHDCVAKQSTIRRMVYRLTSMIRRAY